MGSVAWQQINSDYLPLKFRGCYASYLTYYCILSVAYFWNSLFRGKFYSGKIFPLYEHMIVSVLKQRD